MNTRYAGSRVLTPLMPMRVGTWPTAMLIAEPVIKAVIAVRGIHSTIQPTRARPIKRTMLPEIRAKVLTISSAGISGYSSWTLMTIFPTIVDMTATVYITKC
jgi:hypothetical protein